MKLRNAIQLWTMVCMTGPIIARAQFSSGSTGADGPLVVSNNTTMTLTIPPNGILNFTTVNIGSGATLLFNRNPLNTPVYLLATSNVVINGSIHVSGTSRVDASPGVGGPGGFDGGFVAFQGFPNGDGQGPAGGLAIDFRAGGGFAFPSNGNTNSYGNTLLLPLIGGSGGGAGFSPGNGNSAGGGGGGAILVASSTRVTINGYIFSRGGNGFGGGSGGAIRVVAPVVDGGGNLDVSEGFSETRQENNGSVGRTRIDCTDRFSHRGLTLTGKGTRGNQMVVFPSSNQRLDITSAAGNSISVGTSAPVTINLPVGSQTNQSVRVQATGFTNDVPIRVRITPENAPSATFDGTILQASGNPPFVDVQVTLPVDTVCYVHAWTR